MADVLSLEVEVILAPFKLGSSMAYGNINQKILKF